MITWLEELFASMTWLGSIRDNEDLVSFLSLAVFLAVVLLLSVIANTIAKRVILRGLKFLIEKSRNTYDDALFENQVFTRLSHLAPALVIYLAASLAFSHNPGHALAIVMTRTAMVYMILVIARVLSAFLNGVGDIYQRFEISKQRPIKGIIQAIKVIIFLVALILVIANIIDKSPIILFSGLGAITAVLLLVFKDAILGFVAGIQLASNHMIVPGDWISVPQCKADGDVIDVTLTTVKVQNWDKTITYIPIYKLVSESFTNWRGMTDSGGRRIKRSLLIDLNTIRFCDSDMLKRFNHFHLLQNYLKEARARIDAYNQEHDMNMDRDINARRLTNVGTFRAYIAEYLRKNPDISQEMTFLVRQLAPTEKGLPLEIYVFSKDQRWAHYERIQGDIFDHLFAVIKEFDLAIYQAPAGTDMRYFSNHVTSSKTSSLSTKQENRLQNQGGDPQS